MWQLGRVSYFTHKFLHVEFLIIYDSFLLLNSCTQYVDNKKPLRLIKKFTHVYL